MAHCFACPGGGTAALDFPQTFVKSPFRDFLGGTVVKNSPCNAGDMDLIPGQGTRIPWDMGQLSLSTAATVPTCCSKVPKCCN